MKETFDVYKNRTLFHKMMAVSVVICILSILTCVAFPSFLSSLNDSLQKVFLSILILSLVLTLAGMFMGSMPTNTLYIKAGEIILSADEIIIPQKKMSLHDLESVEIFATSYKGRGTRGGIDDGTSNRIIISLKKREVFEYKFVIQSKQQRDNLAVMLKTWKHNGFKIISNGIDLV